jgi:DNA/RNA endonuclease G (NUC1)
LGRKEKSELGDFAKYLEDNRVTVMEDNTRLPESRGDFAVATLFNGNFDAITKLIPAQDIPGWSFYNGSQNDDLSQSILEKGIAGNDTYALKLDQNNNTIVHNRFLVPDWGVLRFDVHAPDLADLNNTSNFLTVWIEDDNGNFVELKSKDPKAYYPDFDASGSIPNINLPAIDLRPPKTVKRFAALQIQGQTNRVGYGQYGFETFFVDIPREFRGKPRHLQFKLNPKDDSQIVYLDDISVQSIPVKFGMPKLKGQEARDELIPLFENNYLSEKPQYTISYNNITKLANWVSWQLDSNWLSTSKIGRPNFEEDISLPFNPRITHEDYKSQSNPNNPPYNRGHMASSHERKRDIKDFYMTFLTSNAIPQTSLLNVGHSPWNGFEYYYIDLVKSEQDTSGRDIPKNELYITTGGYKDPSVSTVPTDQPIATNAEIPTHIWKLVFVLEEPGLTVAEIQSNPNYIDDVIAVMMPNFTPGLDIISPQEFELPVGRTVKTQNRDDWQDWRKWTVTLEELQDVTNLEFFSYFDETTRNFILSKAASHVSPSSPLLAQTRLTSESWSESGMFINGSIRQDNVIDVGIVHGQIPFIPEQLPHFSSSFEVSGNQYGVVEVSPSQLSIEQISTTQISPSQVGIGEVNIFQITHGQISKFEVNPFEIGIPNNSSSQASSSQIGLTQISPYQVSINEVGSNEIGSSQVSISEVSFIQDRFSQTGSSQISSPKVGFNQISSNQVDSFEINSSEISFASSIPSEQFFPVHNSTSYIINSLNSSLTNLWHNYLNPQTSIDITYKITDLPAGQLAEAQITGFDAEGKPNQGTILIDYNANGIGWFIDRTPLENSEFRMQNAEWAFQATPESEAYGKYDLLTAILHETAHLYKIEESGGLVKKYNKVNGNWEETSFLSDNSSAPTLAKKPLVLIADWMGNIEQHKFHNGGFAEAAADTLFASLVQLDLDNKGQIGDGLGNIYHANGDLIRTQGEIFNSPLHFIGIGQGAVVNNEIIQRLGTYYPHAGGTVNQDGSPNPERDLQMTTLNPFTYSPDLHDSTMGNIQDPEIWVWENVTYADNYYQDISSQENIHGLKLEGETPSGQKWRADVNRNLNDIAKLENPAASDSRSPYREVVRWYTGTANLSHRSEDNLGEYEFIYRRLGDYEINNVFTSNNPNPVEVWYTPDAPKSDFDNGDEDAPWEGIGNGWFYSVSGGNKDLRPYDVPLLDGTLERKEKSELEDFAKYLEDNRVTVIEDNTRLPESRGDFAVPTLFNGNFDAISKLIPNQVIPGWSFYNGLGNDNLSQSPLVKGIAGNETFALELGGDIKKITHNRFVVPEWGVLRFGLHTPSLGGNLTVTLTGQNGVTETKTIFLTEANGPYNLGYNELDTYRIGYGTEGFENFYIDVPDSLRGQVASLEFQINDGTAYLDDVFFKSEHLWLGNPSVNASEARPQLTNGFSNNYLVERPQYSISYSDSLKGPNWVAYKYDQSWLGNLPRTDIWKSDDKLEFVFPILTNGSDYLKSGGYDRGHMITRSHRSRTEKDQIATYFTSSMLPQHRDNNRDNFGNSTQSAWLNFERYIKDELVTVQNKELYVISGGYQFDSEIANEGVINSKRIKIPEYTWKIVVINEPRQSFDQIDLSSSTIAIMTPNRQRPLEEDFPVTDEFLPSRIMTINSLADWRNWQPWVVDYTYIENLTNFRFFTNIPSNTTASLKSELDPIYKSVTNINGTFDEITFWTDSVMNEGTFQSSQSSSSSIGIFQINSDHISSIQISSTQISPTQISSTQISPKSFSDITQISSTQISSPQINFSQISSTQIGSTQIGSTQIGSTQIDSAKISFSNSISNEQIFSSYNEIHNFNPQIVNQLNNSVTNLWSTLLPQTDIDITYQITDLPKGQLAEAQITSFNEFGLPQTGTILIDYNANGIGWFIDITPLENAEFGLENAEWAFQATPESEAYGKYDLLTAILHETAHLYGFIDGYAPFEKHISWNNGTPVFIGDNFTATLTPDLDHLQTAHHPYDLLNTHLAPGIRKLPSELDIQILQAILSEAGSREKGAGRNILQAPLTSTPLIAILNGDFSIDDSSNPQFGWQTRGDSTIVAEQAILREDSPFLSNFSQTFTIPEGAKILQFTIANTQLGPNSQFIPDAFEAALLDAQTLNPLVAPALSLSDSFLNLQPQLLTYKSENVKVSGKINSPTNAQTVYVDISHLTPGTEAILFFDLLGFGEKDSYVNSILDFGFWILDFGFSPP